MTELGEKSLGQTQYALPVSAGSEDYCQQFGGRERLSTDLDEALAWPVVLARSSQSVVGVCDAAMTAPLGGAALAATTTGALNTFAFMIAFHP